MARRFVVGAFRATCVSSVSKAARQRGRQAMNLLAVQRDVLQLATRATTDWFRNQIHRLSRHSTAASGLSHATIALAGPSFECLEDRRLLSSVSFANGVLKVVGDTSAANYLSAWYSAGSNSVKGWTGKDGEQITVPMTQLKKIEMVGGSGNDRFYVDPLVKVPASIAKNGGTDTLVGGYKNITYVNSTTTTPAPNPNPTPNPTPETPPLSGSDPGDSDLIGGDEFSDDTGQTGAPRAVISASDTSGMAGFTVHVNGLGSDLKAGNLLTARYEWDFGDASGRYNELVGFNAAHTYDKAGTYNVTLYVTNQNGMTGSAKTTITVAADTRKTIYVDRQGSDNNNGLSATAAVASLSKARSLMSDNSEILLQRGDSWDVSSTLTVPFDNVIVGAYGTGNKPVLKWTGSSISDIVGLSGTESRDVIVQDLTFTSGTTRGNAIRPRGEGITIRRNEFLNVYDAINSNSKPSNVLVQDNTAPLNGGVRSYFAWVAGEDHVFLGNKVANVMEHVIRMNHYERVLIAHNDLTNNASAGDIAKATISAQRGAYVYVENNKLSDGGLGAGPLGDGDGFQDPDYKNARASWIVFENNNIEDTGIALEHGAEHVAIRNNVIDRDDDSLITVEGFNSSYARGVSDVTIVNNTGVNNDADGKFLHLLGSASGITLKNNLYVAPNMMTGLNKNAVIYVTGSSLGSFKEISNNVWANVKTHWYAEGGAFYVWSSWSDQKGYLTLSEWDAYAVVSDEKLANVTVNSSYAPSTSSAASGAAEKVIGVFTDINGKVRSAGGAWDAGAVEV